MTRIRMGTHLGMLFDDYRLDPSDPGMGDFVTQMLLQHKVLFFRNQHLDHHTFLRVAQRIGKAEIHPFSVEADRVARGLAPKQPYAQYPEITGIHHDEQHKGNLNSWHSDLNWRASPTFASLLRAVQLPPRGGDTCWADMGAAYRSLDEATRRRLDGLRIVHDWMQIYFPDFDGTDEVLVRLRERYPPQSHPLVLTHPLTGERVLFSNKVSGVRIEDLDEAESRRILDMVHLLAWRPEFQCRFQWQEGDVAIWDNLATQHYAVSDYWPSVRKMERITIEGQPVG